VLGGGDVTMEELVSLYGALTNEGVVRPVRYRADQPLAAEWVLRAATSLRIENHTDASQDARSVHGSIELRWRMRR